MVAAESGLATIQGDGPVRRLSLPAPGEAAAFLDPLLSHCAERFTRLGERAALRQRTTMSYDPARVVSAGRNAPSEASDSALDARRHLCQLLASMPRDCAGILLDVLVFGKGLQDVETERRLPRRSAKYLLRAGLEHLAIAWNLSRTATGPETSRSRVHRPADATPREFG